MWGIFFSVIFCTHFLWAPTVFVLFGAKKNKWGSTLPGVEIQKLQSARIFKLYVGIKGNERVDREAKTAALEGQSELDVPTPNRAND